jgi:hypothetical protein
MKLFTRFLLGVLCGSFFILGCHCFNLLDIRHIVGIFYFSMIIGIVLILYKQNIIDEIKKLIDSDIVNKNQ